MVSSKGKQTLKSGQILASAILFQNDVNLLWQKLGERGANKGKIMPAPALKMKGKRRPLTTVAASRLYAQVLLFSIRFTQANSENSILSGKGITATLSLPGFQSTSCQIGLRFDQGIRKVQQGSSSIFGRVRESYFRQQESPQN